MREEERERQREEEREKTRRQQMEEKDRREREEIEKMSLTEDERAKLLREHTLTMEKYVEKMKRRFWKYKRTQEGEYNIPFSW